MKYLWIILVIFLGIFLINPILQGQASTPLPPGQTSQNSNEFEQAVLDRFNSWMDKTYAVSIFEPGVENAQVSAQPGWATAWVVIQNPQTGEVVPGEPLPTLGVWDGNAWKVYFPFDEGWLEAVNSAPQDLVTAPTLSTWLNMNVPQRGDALTAAISGYLLPWEGGKTVYLSRSVQHDADITSGNAHYSFDFYVPQTMFNIQAAKAGTVWLFSDDVPNNNHDDVNYLVLQDLSTNPVTYQLYLHLAQGSIPSELRSVGASVRQGQFIGVADNTGQSTGHHLHFQVESTPYWTYWGRSVDITFADVDINGGRPRVTVDLPYCTWAGDVCTTTRSSYVSQNYPQPTGLPPYGDMTVPTSGSLLQQSTIALSGWAADSDGSVSQARFIARYGSTWQQVGPTFNSSPISYTWDVCASQVPDGAVSLALQIQDSSGNWAPGLPGLRHILKHYACPAPPTCTPASGQVAIFSDPNFTGSCTLLSQGSYTSASAFGAVGVDNAASVKVGSNVMTTLYMNSNLSGRGETFTAQDSNLKDNIISSDTLSSLRVQPRNDLPGVPVLTWPLNGASFPWYTSHSLVWDNGGSALEYQVELDGAPSAWLSVPYFHTGSLSSATHSWRVRARNANGTSAWSTLRSFTIASQANAPAEIALDAPYNDDMEGASSTWLGSVWDRTLETNHTPGGQISWKVDVEDASIGYDNGSPIIADLTSPSINLPASGYSLRFWYLYETEGSGTHWDQRWLQVSVDNGSYTNLIQLSDDEPNLWLQSPVIDLSAYAGSMLRFRFHFETLDAAFNTKKGWFVDDFSISISPAPVCSPAEEPDNTPAQARPLSYNTPLTGTLCPGGDVDYFQFIATPGKTGITTIAQTSGSPLDTHLTLLDSDGSSVLASNDDQIPNNRTDSYLSTDLIPGHIYFIKLRAWDHPSAGSADHTYTVNLSGNDPTDPQVAITSPPGGTFLPSSSVTLQASASDDQSGASHVRFSWHSGDWQNSNWVVLGEDWDAQDGWSYSFDVSSLAEQTGIAFLARAFDWAGNYTDTAIWDLAVDRTAPVTSLQSAQASQTSTLVRLVWSGSDGLSGMDHFDLEVQTDGSAFQPWLSGVPATTLGAWFAGTSGHTYGFRLRGVDRLGNVEAYPSAAETSTTIPSSVCSAGDAYETDNTFGSARQVSGTSVSQTHNFCNPASGSGWANDQDWLRFTLPAGKTVFIQVASPDNGVAANLRLYASNGTTVLGEAGPAGLGMPSFLYWTVSQNTTLFLRVTPLYGRITGDSTTYQVSLLSGTAVFLPTIRK